MNGVGPVDFVAIVSGHQFLRQFVVSLSVGDDFTGMAALAILSGVTESCFTVVASAAEKTITAVFLGDFGVLEIEGEIELKMTDPAGVFEAMTPV